jgi:integrase/recombinase XerD
MEAQLLSVINPSYFHGRYPFDPDRHGEVPLLSQDPDKKSPHQVSLNQSFIAQVPDRGRALERLLNRHGGVEFPGKEQFEAYMHHKYRRNCSIGTMRSAAESLTQFLFFCQRTGMRRLEQLGREELEAFVEFEQDRGLKPATVRTRLGAVYAFIRFLIEKKVLGYELLESRIRLKLPDRLPRAIDPEDLSRLLSVVHPPRDRALILLLLRTGMRIGELLNTRVSDVDFREQKILIYQAQKTAVGRVVYYSDDAHKALINWLRLRPPFKEYLFYGRGRTHLSYEAARTLFKKYVQAAGLEHSGYTLHCLRHTFATELLNAGMRLECLQVLLGHTNLEVTRRYARLSDKTREAEYFEAMRRIEKGEAYADDEHDH